MILWFGIGIWSKIVIVFAGAVFPLLINTYTGVKNVNRVLVAVVRSFGANEWQLMKVVVLPNSLPYIIAGLRLAIGRAILGVVVGEFFGSSQGLGYMIASAATNTKSMSSSSASPSSWAFRDPHPRRQAIGIPPRQLAAGDGKDVLTTLSNGLRLSREEVSEPYGERFRHQSP
jgi:hypothetical protein